MQRFCFLLCDIQERFRPLIHKFPTILFTAQKLIEAGKILNIPLVVTEQYPKALGKTCEELNIQHCSLKEEKFQFSMTTPKVLDFLKQQQINHVVLFGIESHVCVLQSALELRRLDYNVYVLQDVISSTNPSEIPIAIQRMRDAKCQITTSESFLFEYLKTSQHEKFKQISQLVKTTQQNPLHNSLL